MFDHSTFQLPIAEVIPEIRLTLRSESTLLLHAPPGAGKSTLIPLALLDEPWLSGKKIILLEPRRLAAKAIAGRMADMLGEQTGETVGYRIRFETLISDQTRIEVVTEGILTRMLQSDNVLPNIGLVVFDEFHERSLHADLALALCREAQQVLRPDLRMLIMSATMDTGSLSSMLNCKVVSSEGKQFPVEVHYTGDHGQVALPEQTARLVADILLKTDGDILVFLPGEGEIAQCAEMLRTLKTDVSIYPLYGRLPMRDQQAAILPRKDGKRKVVLTTSIAETSLTIEGIKVVVDTGLRRISRFHPGSGLSRLETVMISRDAADQRAGRAGRLGPGTCFRMWAPATFARMAPYRTPEIGESDLTPMMLEMAKWGVSDLRTLTWLTPPPNGSVQYARETLSHLNAIENNRITQHGKELHALPCHPRIAHMLLRAKEDQSVGLAADLAALLEERDPMGPDSGIDINLRIEWLRRMRSMGKAGHKLNRIEKQSAQYRAMLGASVDNGPVDHYETGILLAYAFPERIACARTGNNAQFQLANGKIAVAGHKDDLAREPWLAVAHMDARDGLGKIFLASPLHPKDLLPMVAEKENLVWDTRKGGLQAKKEIRIGSIVLKSTPLPDPDPELIEQATMEALKTDWKQLLNWDEDAIQMQNRILSLRKWNPEQNWPDVSPEVLISGDLQWLLTHAPNARKNEDLLRIPVDQAIRGFLPFELQHQLDILAPEKIEVPSGSKIRLNYTANGDQPILAVRLQEVFGMLDTPAINAGRTRPVMHLLSPGFKPVQVTGDLHSFWQTTYFEVKKELQRRYPRHAWPENPLEAKAVAKGRPR